MSAGAIKPDNIAKGIAAKEALGEESFYKALEESLRKEYPSLDDAELNAKIVEAKRLIDQIESELPQELINDEIAVAKNLLADFELGKVIKGKKNLLTQAKVSGKFRQFTINLEGQNPKTERAGTFWNTSGELNPELVQYFSKDGKYYLKHDPRDGRLLFFERATEQCLGFTMDQDKLFETVLNGDYEKLVENLKQIHGFNNNYLLKFPSGELVLSDSKANIVLGKWNPNAVEGVSNQLGTDDVIQNLTIFRNYAFADDILELRPGSVHMLNIPEGMYDMPTFFDDFNKAFLDMVIANQDKIEVVFATKPDNIDLFKAWDTAIKDFSFNENSGLFEPSGFAKEVKYLRDRGIKKVWLNDGSTLNLEEIDLSELDWKTNWKY